MPAPKCCRASARSRIMPFPRPMIPSGWCKIPAGASAGTDLPCPDHSICPAAIIHSGIRRTPSSRELLHLANDRIAHLRGGYDPGALGFDIGGAQALGENGGDRLVDQVGLPVHVE